MKNLGQRRVHWSDPVNRYHNLTDSLPYPFEIVFDLFHGCRVLEIGPGQGRQYLRLAPVVESYDVCDIAPTVMDEPELATIPRYVIDSYDTVLGEYDVVHFWYVLHHIPKEERAAFFGFVNRNLKLGGRVIFNTPIITHEPDWYKEDGIGTSYCGLYDVYDATRGTRLVVEEVHRIHELSTGLLIVLRKPC
jgi:hypothetical protein